MPPMTDTQYRVLGLMVEGAILLEQWGGGTYDVIGANVPRHTRAVRWDTKRALERPDFIRRVPKKYPNEWRITDAGRAAYAQAQAQRVREE